MERAGFFQKLKRDIRHNSGLYLLVLPAFLLVLLFAYAPMYGIILAFKDYSSALGITGSRFIGFENFQRFFSGYYFGEVMWNTLSISLYSLAVGFPVPVIFALMLNAAGGKFFKKSLQMVSYAPYFISVVVIVAMLSSFLDAQHGIINTIIKFFGGEPKDFLTNPRAFKTIYVLSGLWQSMGWSCIVYIAALAAVDPGMYEAATIDGANKMQKIIYIDIPSIAPTMITLLILSMGNILSVGFEKTYLMQNDLNISSSEVIATYVYKKGLLSSDQGLGTAVGLFNSVINFVMLAASNIVARRAFKYSIW